MLVLARKRDEKLMIGNDIVLTVIEIRGDKVRLGITAPQNVSVYRQEVYDAIVREQQSITPNTLNKLVKERRNKPDKQ